VILRDTAALILKIYVKESVKFIYLRSFKNVRDGGANAMSSHANFYFLVQNISQGP
jgi:hypothetical protein